MTQKLYFIPDTNADIGRGTNDANAAGSNTPWSCWKLSTSPGGSDTTKTANTVNGPTNGIEFNSAEYISLPLSADFTISGTVTFNIWGLESAMTANAGLQVIVERINSTLGIASTITNSEFGTELGTSNAVNTWTATPTSTAMNRGDRIRARILINDAGGTMVSGSTASIHIGGPTGGASGDSYVQFNENLTFETSDPAGTVFYPTDTASAVNPGSATEKFASLSRGAAATTSTTNSTAGYTSPIQITDTAGGTAIEWYTNPLNAFTLGGLAKANVRCNSAAGISAAARVEIAVCNNDGTGASVWGAGNANDSSLITTGAEAAKTVYLSGDDTSVTTGQRLRIRVFIDDSASSAMSTGTTASVYYAGTSGGASGDTFVTIPQTVTEQVLTTPVPIQVAFIEIRPNV